jgi:hypothetical protein
MALPKTSRKKKVRAAPRIKRGSKTTAPGWDGWEDWDGAKYHKHKEYVRSFYYDNFKPVDLIPDVFKWMEQNGYNKAQITCAKKADPYTISITAAIVARMLLDGMPDFNKKEADYWTALPGTGDVMNPSSDFLRRRIEEAIEKGSKVVEEKKAEEKAKKGVYVPSIQERLQHAAWSMSSVIDEHFEKFVSDSNTFDPKGIDVLRELRSKDAKGAHGRIIKSEWQAIYNEYHNLLNFPSAAKLKLMGEREQDHWAQLKEGYSHLDNKALKKVMTFLQDVLGACDMLMKEGKVNRKPRKPKAINKEKVVAKMKYRKTDEDLKLVSINPSDIIGADELWVYNVKTRKIGKYVASVIDPLGAGREGSGLSIKGTTIIGFKEEESIQKTLRKPKEQLKEFADCGKVKLRKYMDDIKTTDIKLNGRINLDTVLLKIQ